MSEAPVQQLKWRLCRLPLALLVAVASNEKTLPDAEREAGCSGLSLEDAVTTIAESDPEPDLVPLQRDQVDAFLAKVRFMDASSVDKFLTGKCTWGDAVELARENILVKIGENPRYRSTADAFRAAGTPIDNVYTYMNVVRIAAAATA